MDTNEDIGRIVTGRRAFLGLAAGAVAATQVAAPAQAQAAPQIASFGRTPEISGVRPFRISVPQRRIDDLRLRLRMTRWPDRETVDDRSQGAQLDQVRPLVEHWGRSYDWRRVEAG